MLAPMTTTEEKRSSTIQKTERIAHEALMADVIAGLLEGTVSAEWAGLLYKGLFYATIRHHMNPTDLFETLAKMLTEGAMEAQARVDEREARRDRVEKLFNEAGYSREDRWIIMIETGL